MHKTYPVLEVHQFGSATDADRLLLFAPLAKDLAAWAGIPRKGWRIRMLFQRWVTQGREKELERFWNRASSPPSPEDDYILSPTAIVIAIQGEPQIQDGLITLDYDSPIASVTDDAERLKILAENISDRIYSRLAKDTRGVVDGFSKDPLKSLPDVNHDYVLEFALQLEQMKTNASWFIEKSRMSDEELPELITSMEALVRPALVVDGQHRLWGAQAVEKDVSLPVVAIAETTWPQQIFQFVVINEKAQKVDSELLNDIFASSLTPGEQGKMRTQFRNVRVDIEQRIAGVLAGRETESPFYEMVTLNLPNPPESEADAYISQAIIQNLIDGGRGSKGWRSDNEFYEQCIKPNFPAREDWEDWREGHWRGYWFAFWEEVIAVFTPRARRLKDKTYEIWNRKEQTNLTKGVGLKIFQKFFIEIQIEAAKEAGKGLDVLIKHLGEDAAGEAIAEQQRESAIPVDLDAFRERVRAFAERFPTRFFTATWNPSLDDKDGHDRLLYQMREAYSRDSWRASGGGVFQAGE